MRTNKEHRPKCKSSFQGAPIRIEDQHLFNATHFSRKIGISDGDSVGYWKCPDCGHQWNRTGSAFAKQARRNIDRQRA